MAFPRERQNKIYSTDPLERLNGEGRLRSETCRTGVRSVVELTGSTWPTAEVGFSAVNDRKLCKTADGLFRKVGTGKTSETRQPSHKLIVSIAVKTKKYNIIMGLFAITGGGGEIRTHERLPFAGFQDRCNRPLCHTSSTRLRQAPASAPVTTRSLHRQCEIIAWRGAGMP
jgi:hypothetical protein